jgi:hypothetical protein
MLHYLTIIATQNATKTRAIWQPKTHAFLQQLPLQYATKMQRNCIENATKKHAKMLHYLTTIAT